jgi:peptidyl-prolyl cis-trans isomerase A (cyclophilin A)
MNCFILFALALIVCLATRTAQAQDKSPTSIAPNKDRPVAVFNTNRGVFKAELFTDLAPVTAGNFIDLIEKKFYDGTIFHRVIESFMIQGGDPSGNGTGGPGYKIKDEFGEGLVHGDAGILSMANSGPNSGGSQFFITLVATPWLDGKHAIFGRIVDGLDVVKAIGASPTGRGDRPIDEVKIITLTVEKPSAEAPEKSVEAKP